MNEELKEHWKKESKKLVKKKVLIPILSFLWNLVIPILILIAIFSLVIAIYSAFQWIWWSNLKSDEYKLIHELIHKTTLFWWYENDRPSWSVITWQWNIDSTIANHMWRSSNLAWKSVAVDIHEIWWQHWDENSVKRTIEMIMQWNFEQVWLLTWQTISYWNDLIETDSSDSKENERVEWLNEMYKKYWSDWDFSYFKNYHSLITREWNTYWAAAWKLTYPFYFYSTISWKVTSISDRSWCISVYWNEYVIWICHFHNLSVKVWQQVWAWQILWTMWMRWMTTWPHIHYEIWKKWKMSIFSFLSNSWNSWIEMITAGELKWFILEWKVVKNWWLYYFDHVWTNIHCLSNPESCSWSLSWNWFWWTLWEYIDQTTKMVMDELNLKTKNVLYTIYAKEWVSKDRSWSMRQWDVSADWWVWLFQLQYPINSDWKKNDDILFKNYKEFKWNVEWFQTMSWYDNVITSNYKWTWCNQWYILRTQKKHSYSPNTQSKPGWKFDKWHVLAWYDIFYKNIVNTTEKEQAEKLWCDIENDKRFDFNARQLWFIEMLRNKISSCDRLIIWKTINDKNFDKSKEYTKDSYEYQLCLWLAYNWFTIWWSQPHFSSILVNMLKDAQDWKNTYFKKCSVSSVPITNCNYSKEFAQVYQKYLTNWKVDNSEYFETDSKTWTSEQKEKLNQKDKINKEKIKKMKDEIFEKIKSFSWNYDLKTDSSIHKFVSPNISFNTLSYKPEWLEKVWSEYVIDEKWNSLLRKEANSELKKMAKKFYEDNKEKIKVVSAYRTYEYQVRIKKWWCSDVLCAKAWFSEHQTWLVVDLWSASKEETWVNSKDLMEKYEWMVKNAHNFWFTQSYQKWVNVDWYEVEKWHWRFVWKDLATKLKEKWITFSEFSYAKLENENKK